MKSCITEKSNSIQKVNVKQVHAVQISSCSMDESEQKVFNNQSEIEMTHLYCMRYSD